MNACFCSHPECLAKGCILQRRVTMPPAGPFTLPYAPPKYQPDNHGCQPLRPLTEEDVRRIVREELEKRP